MARHFPYERRWSVLDVDGVPASTCQRHREHTRLQLLHRQRVVHQRRDERELRRAVRLCLLQGGVYSHVTDAGNDVRGRESQSERDSSRRFPERDDGW